MSEEEPREPSREERATAPGDVGRRVAARREELGLSRQEVAERSGSATTYIQYLEEQQSMPSMSFMLRLANALDTTVSELTGSNMDLPPGTGHAGYHSQLIELSADECRELLSTHGVGRIAVSTTEGPSVVPVNYVVVGSLLAFRTAAGATPAAAAGHMVAFEVDHIDDALSQGWSVLATGTASTVTDPNVVQNLNEVAYTDPWPDGRRDLWLTIAPTRLTGRRIHVRQSHTPPSG
ncbi:pyridoxamine 5'-phosphate oxidase family protein [Streptomyces sp. NBC_01800]|uniref:pyridoxamine 5'-phosphate oxidase family protein n=1 Tax=Streptomyces sp. NBC_01800 TaxID=2975945 RepID=UPI002DDBC3D6|nr:pyridoxamine 5'-phosphate oxidase family protein [Streptomyces sp. NBC_01800]WSA66365.1 pyridoxamine 5'-phosphate oxidase family protein [Streptomyces sp. NBC_01800]